MKPPIEKKIWPEINPDVVDNGLFPFPIQLNLSLAISNWRKYARANHFFHKEFSDRFEQTIEANPFLLEPIEDVSRLKGLEDFLELLFEPVLPREGWSNVIMAASMPFMLYPVLTATDNFYRLITAEGAQLTLRDSPPGQELLNCRTIGAYRFLLYKYYQVELPFEFPVISVYTVKGTGLFRYFKVTGIIDFVGVAKTAPLPRLKKEVLKELAEQPFEFEVWKKLIPPENFLFSGVNLLSLMDVTTEESSARIQRILLGKLEGNEAEQFQILQQELRNLFRLADLRLGLATLQRDGELNFSSTSLLWNSLLLKEIPGSSVEWVKESLYEKVLQTGREIIIEDLEKQAKTMGRTEKGLMELGFRNLLLVPLVFDGKPVGILEVSSPKPGGIHGLSILKINHIKPVFANALKYHRDDFENKVEAAMMEHYTAIHPAIQWRFREATIRQLNKKENGNEEVIKFENVFPFYGSLDVRASSNKRNLAVHRDLLDNLGTAQNALQKAGEILPFSVLGELAHKTEQKLKKLQESFQTGDEPTISEFIRKEINPALEHLHQNYPAASDVLDVYLKYLNPRSGVFTRNQEAYEKALMLTSQTIVSVLEEEEDALQALFPCYFEKYQTDGVEYNIYTGASIAPHRKFVPLYLDNIRLRQLDWTCTIMRKIDELQPHFKKLLKEATCSTPGTGCGQLPPLDTSLEIAPLILAFGNPITLHFRMDEKRLDVEGSYNVRYEIIKKRIDKALILNTNERLTQPGYIAIVYARVQEAIAYRSHIEYLAAQHHIQPDYEDVELEPLQGAEGLKAMRLKVCKF